jgi:hypothetical protein
MQDDVVSLNTALEYIDRLDLDDQQYLQEIVQRRIIDARRNALVRRARQALVNERKGLCKSGSVKELLADLND